MPGYVISRCEEVLKENGKQISGSRVLILGLAYKPNVDDDRESPSYVLMEKLETLGAQVDYHDPHIQIIRLSREHSKYAGVRSQDPSSKYDLFLLATHHDVYSVVELMKHGVPVVDTRHLGPQMPPYWQCA